MSSRAEKKRKASVGRRYRVGSLVSFWEMEGYVYTEPVTFKRRKYGIVSGIGGVQVWYFSSDGHRCNMNRFVFESNLETHVQVEVF